MEKHNSLEENTLKLKEKLTISESHLPKTFEKSSPKPNKSNIKINNFLTNTRTPVDLFIDNFSRRERNINTPCNAFFFTPQEAIKQELELRNLPPDDLVRFDGNPVHWPEFIDNFYHRIHKKLSFNDSLHMDHLMKLKSR